MYKNIVWPKTPPPLTEEQKKYKADFLKLWHEVLPNKYGLIEKFNHSSKILQNSAKKKDIKTLEIGAGLGEHLFFEDLSHQEYTALEYREDFVETIRSRFPTVRALSADIQKKTDLPTHYFDRIIAIHVLEHLPHLPHALQEVKRLLKTDGEFVAVIPCEGGLAYQLARNISAKRIFEKKFKTSYDPIIKNEHVNQAWEILWELKKLFNINEKSFWPLKIPLTQINLVIALSCRLKN